MDIDRVVTVYIAMRDKKKQLEKIHKDMLNELESKMKVLEDALAQHLNATGATGARAKSGVVSRVLTTRYYGSDWESIDQYEKEHGVVLRENRISKSAIDNILENGGEVPLGVRSVSEYSIRVSKLKGNNHE